MSRAVLSVLLALAIPACATGNPPPPPAAAPGTPAGMAAPGAGPGKASAAGWAVSIVGTPFALGFKTVVCAATVVVAAPIAGLLTVSGDSYNDGLAVLGDGVAQNCGPPYVISPRAAS